MYGYFTCFGKQVLFVDCTFDFDGATVFGLYVHDVDDVNRDGDGVIGNCGFPSTDEDAERILQNETLVTDFEVLDTVRFSNGTRPSDYADFNYPFPFL